MGQRSSKRQVQVQVQEDEPVQVQPVQVQQVQVQAQQVQQVPVQEPVVDEKELAAALGLTGDDSCTVIAFTGFSAQSFERNSATLRQVLGDRVAFVTYGPFIKKVQDRVAKTPGEAAFYAAITHEVVQIIMRRWPLGSQHVFHITGVSAGGNVATRVANALRRLHYDVQSLFLQAPDFPFGVLSQRFKQTGVSWDPLDDKIPCGFQPGQFNVDSLYARVALELAFFGDSTSTDLSTTGHAFDAKVLNYWFGKL